MKARWAWRPWPACFVLMMNLRFIVNAVGADQLADLWATVDSARHEDQEDGEGYASCQLMKLMNHEPSMSHAMSFASSRSREIDWWHLLKDKSKVHG